MEYFFRAVGYLAYGLGFIKVWFAALCWISGREQVVTAFGTVPVTTFCVVSVITGVIWLRVGRKTLQR